MTERLAGKKAVISGRAAGTGRVTSLLCATEGARVEVVEQNVDFR